MSHVCDLSARRYPRLTIDAINAVDVLDQQQSYCTHSPQHRRLAHKPVLRVSIDILHFDNMIHDPTTSLLEHEPAH